LNMNDPGIVRDPAAGIPTRINVSFLNAEEVLTHGIDLGLMFRSDFGGQAGTFSAGANASYVLAYEIPQSSVPAPLWDEDIASCDSPGAVAGTPPPEDASCDVAGLRNFNTFARSLPRLRAQFPLGWTMDGHTAAIISNLVGSYTDDADSDATPGERYRPIHAQLTFDLQYAYRLKEGEHLATTFKVGVVNLLDTPPPYVNAGYGYDVLTHDPRGRLIYGRLIQEF
jgi:iron complex outermembrane receptor protein